MTFSFRAYSIQAQGYKKDNKKGIIISNNIYNNHLSTFIHIFIKKET